MAFETSIHGNEQQVIILKDTATGTEAEIFAFGALLNRFIVAQNGVPRNIVLGFKNVEDAQTHITNAFQSAKLSPFVCRLKEGKYTFENQTYHIHKFFLQREAIHGLLFDAPFKITEQHAGEDSASVTLFYAYHKRDEGFPFSYEITITYRLQHGNRLTLVTTVENTGLHHMPLSDGWHPYFALGARVNDLQVQFNSSRMVEFDQKLLPSGRLIDFTKYKQAQMLNDIELDNCFVLDSFDEPAFVMQDEKENLYLKITPDASYPYLQIYTPKDRKSIAVENLSSVPDAFNNTIGLLVLAPLQHKTFTTTYEAGSLY